MLSIYHLLNREMHRITEAAAIAHGQQLAAARESRRHLAAERFDLLRVFGEELLLHLHALTALAENFVSEILGRLIGDNGSDQACATSAASFRTRFWPSR